MMEKICSILIVVLLIITSVVGCGDERGKISNEKDEGNVDITIYGIYVLSEDYVFSTSDGTRPKPNERCVFVTYDIKNISDKNYDMPFFSVELLMNNTNIYELSDFEGFDYPFKGRFRKNGLGEGTLEELPAKTDILKRVAVFTVNVVDLSDGKTGVVNIDLDNAGEFWYPFNVSEISMINDPMELVSK